MFSTFFLLSSSPASRCSNVSRCVASLLFSICANYVGAINNSSEDVSEPCCQPALCGFARFDTRHRRQASCTYVMSLGSPVLRKSLVTVCTQVCRERRDVDRRSTCGGVVILVGKEYAVGLLRAWRASGDEQTSAFVRSSTPGLRLIPGPFLVDRAQLVA